MLKRSRSHSRAHRPLMVCVACCVALAACRTPIPIPCQPSVEIPYDGIDQDCDGDDLRDIDADGCDGAGAGARDCNDLDPTINPEADEVPYDGIDQDCDGSDLTDVDGDGWDAVVAGGTDCDDEDPEAFPGADEIPYDGVDQDCDGADMIDVDGDGWAGPEAGGEDCDDQEPQAFPGNTEVWYDGIDQDCDGWSDYDQDADGFDHDDHGGTDCDDEDFHVRPDAYEIWYDGVDQDCDGWSDYDQDYDGHDSVVYGGGDCDDLDATINPDATETWYDGVDQNCDGGSDYDQDADGYDRSEDGGADCDDLNAAIQPDASEVCDDVDNDCDGLTDGLDPDVLDASIWYVDADGDGYGSDATTVVACELPAGFADNTDDCDDGDAASYPGGTEVPYDGADQDCDGSDLTDVDGDGWDAEEASGEDCDDSDPAIHPDATELAGDGIDNDCDGLVDEYIVCADGSGDFTTVQDGIDGVPDPAALELCPGTYEENLTLGTQTISIGGGGDEPADVLLRGVSTGHHVTLATGTDATFYWLAMESDGSESQYGFNGFQGITGLTLDTVDLCSPSEEYQYLLKGTCSGGGDIEIEGSHICVDESFSKFSVLYMNDTCGFTMSKSIVELNNPSGDYRFYFFYDAGEFEFTNNIRLNRIPVCVE